ncbi:MAG: tRNA (adenosine(37)-N6)-threonylcarbamoyltransferase complex ATPase subunit type 1 TsaE [Nitrospira sp.]
MPSRPSARPSRATLSGPATSRARRSGRPSTPVAWTITLPSRAATESFGRAIGRALTGGETLALSGELGAGKTALVRGIAAGLGAPPNTVSSPTFVLIHEYHGRLPLAHMDLYRLQTPEEAENIGMEQYFQPPTVTAIEWAEKFFPLLPTDRLMITLRHKAPTTRTASVSAQGPRATALATALRRHTGQKRPAASRTKTAAKGRRRRS